MLLNAGTGFLVSVFGWWAIFQIAVPLVDQHALPWGYTVPVLLRQLLVGGVLGLVQMRLLRGTLAEPGWWLVATAVSWPIGTMLPLLPVIRSEVPGSALWLLSVALGGVLLRIAQWLVLRRTFRNAGWWVVGSGCAFLLMSLTTPLGIALETTVRLWPLLRLLGWLAYSVVTAAVVKLLRARPAAMVHAVAEP